MSKLSLPPLRKQLAGTLKRLPSDVQIAYLNLYPSTFNDNAPDCNVACVLALLLTHAERIDKQLALDNESVDARIVIATHADGMLNATVVSIDAHKHVTAKADNGKTYVVHPSRVM